MPTFWWPAYRHQKVGQHGGPRPASCPKVRHVVEPETSSQTATTPNTTSASSYQNSIVLSPATEDGSRPVAEVLSFASPPERRPKDKYPKKRRPDSSRPCASLRANLRHVAWAAVRQNSLCAARAAQTRCRKSEHEALALFGANARSQTGVIGRPARLVTKLALNPINDYGSCY